jgi:hypothetical protein
MSHRTRDTKTRYVRYQSIYHTVLLRTMPALAIYIDLALFMRILDYNNILLRRISSFVGYPFKEKMLLMHDAYWDKVS